MARPRKEEIAEKRRKRMKWGDPRLRLSVDTDTVERLKKEGKVPRWVSDDGNRIGQLQQRGYEFVKDENVKVGETEDGNTDMGANVSRVTGKDKNGNPMRQYLMVQSAEFFEEDQREKAKQNDKIDEAIRRGEAVGTQQTRVDDGRGNRTYVKGETKYNP